MEELEMMESQCGIDRPIVIITAEINFYKNQAGAAILEIGKRLLEAKQQLQHGEWGEWLEREVEFSERTAQNIMRIAREYKNPQTLAEVGNSVSKALLLLSIPQEEREEFIEQKHEVMGVEKSVAEMSTRELERLTKELEAERAKNAELQMSLEVQLEINEVDIQKEIDIEERIQRAEEEKRELEAELEELRSAKVEPSEDVLEQIRQEAERVANEKQQKLLEKKIQKANKEAEEAKQEAEQAKKELEMKEKALAVAESVADATMEEKEKMVKDLERRLALAGGSRMEVFKVYFNEVQGQLNKMLACLEEMKQAGEETDKLRAAVAMLCDKTKEAIE